MGRLDGKVFLGYGTGSGMGKATAKLFASEGAKVVLATNPGKNGPATLEEIKAAGGETVYIPTNCYKAEDIVAAAQAAVDVYGKLDVMLYQPGAAHGGFIIEDNIDEWRDVFELNVYGPARAIQAAAKQMLKTSGGGSIIITASMSAISPSTENACYGATKAAVNQLMRVAAMELAPAIRVNSINPGLTATKSIAVLTTNEKASDKVMSNIPMKSFATAEDIAHAALFLASDESSYVTGHDLTVDGGMHFYGLPDWVSHPEKIV